MIDRLLRYFNSPVKIVVFACIGAILFFGITVLLLRGPVDSDIGIGQEFVDPDGPVLLNNATELFSLFPSSDHYEAFSDDLSVYARNTGIPSGDTGVTYTVTKTSKKDNTITVDGFFNSLEDETTRAVVAVQSFGKITTSFPDSSLDLTLPSGSIEDQFIGSLPIETDDFIIGYSTTESIYLIDLYSDSIEIRNSIKSIIANGADRVVSDNEIFFYTVRQ